VRGRAIKVRWQGHNGYRGREKGPNQPNEKSRPNSRPVEEKRKGTEEEGREHKDDTMNDRERWRPYTKNENPTKESGHDRRGHCEGKKSERREERWGLVMGRIH